MSHELELDWNIEQDYQITATFTPGDPGKVFNCLPENSYPPEDPCVEDVVIKWNGSVLDEQERRNHGFTPEVMEEILEAFIQKATDDAEAASEDAADRKMDEMRGN
jgi:hypothetical protein